MQYLFVGPTLEIFSKSATVSTIRFYYNIRPNERIGNTILISDLSTGFGVISARFEDVPLVENDSVDSIYSFVESNVKNNVIQPLLFTVFPYSEVESAFR